MIHYGQVIELIKKVSRYAFDENLRAHVMTKGPSDYVTDIDLKISTYLKEELKKADASIGFFSEEESGALRDPSWILDPIDGTTNLIFGYRLSSVSLALYENGRVAFGAVYNPFSDEMFAAEVGKGATLNGKPLRVSDREMKDALIEFGAGSTRKNGAEESFSIAKKVFYSCVDIRRICSSALDLCYIAAGRIDGYFERVLKPWDIAAGALILREAGGVITDYEGKELQYRVPTSVIAGNGKVNPDLAKIISEVTTEYESGLAGKVFKDQKAER